MCSILWCIYITIQGKSEYSPPCYYLYHLSLTHTHTQLMNQWITRCKELDVPVSDDISLISVLADPYEIRQWNANGLPRDNVSTENAILVTRGRRWPLMIDPQEQVTKVIIFLMKSSDFDWKLNDNVKCYVWI